MPRGKKKTKGAGGKHNGGSREASDVDTPDNMSVVSNLSDAGSFAADLEAVGIVSPPIQENGEVDESSSQEDFEEKLKDCIDGCTQKSAKGRTTCLTGLAQASKKKYLYDFFVDRRMTVTDAIARCLKKGKAEEVSSASMCAIHLCLQLGAGDEAGEAFQELKPILIKIIMDASAPLKARSNCAIALSMCSFIAGGEIEEIVKVMESFESIFKGSYLKGDGGAPMLSPEMSSLHEHVLSAWTLLVSIAPQSVLDDIIEKHLPKLPELLASNNVELRIEAGEAIALLFELARDENEDFEFEDLENLCDILKKLATDSNKFRAKVDRRKQRSSFRDVLRTVEEADAPEMSVKFGRECLEIYSWVRKKQYDMFCSALGTGMNLHLQENDLVRDVFGLGAPIPQGAAPVSKSSKIERTLYNAAAFKARTKTRLKNRDKRSVAFNS
ncbi:unnamed protein product [Owenia fusiformis]|uniref:Interferon-related developmental regulator 1 n=1 Tax=Owenia fusiformis TaxID=6347 RepID=A0A8S4NPL2_OWEFU|nr:unnamed protein product [Owenia fusiformis]